MYRDFQTPFEVRQAWQRSARSPLVHVEHRERAIAPDPGVGSAHGDDSDLAPRCIRPRCAFRVELSDANEPHRISPARDGVEYGVPGADAHDAAVAREQ